MLAKGSGKRSLMEQASPFGSWSCYVRKARSERTARLRLIGLNMLHASCASTRFG